MATVTERDEENMREAIVEASSAAAEGKMPFGSVLSDAGGKILFRSRNQCQQAKKRGGGMGDVTRHAEMELVRLFTTQLPVEERASCTLYTSTEPCVMCAGAIYWSGGKYWSSPSHHRFAHFSHTCNCNSWKSRLWVFGSAA